MASGTLIGGGRTWRGRTASATPALAFLLLAAAVVMRRPDAVTNAQFWAEDGQAWYGQAYQLGPLRALVVPDAGYLQSVSRIVGAVDVMVGLRWAPLISNCLAIVISLIPVALILTPRFAAVVPSRAARLIMAVGFVLIPNIEVHGTITNSIWYLAVAAAMIVALPPAPNTRWLIVDYSIVVLFGLSAILSLLLAPFALYKWSRTKRREDLVLALTIVVCALLQLAVFLLPSTRNLHPTLAAGWRSLAEIVANRVVGGAVTSSDVLTQNWPGGLVWPVLISVIAGGALVFALWRGPLALRIFDGFALVSCLAALLDAAVNPGTALWPLLATSRAGERYFLIPTLAVAATSVWLFSLLPRRPRWVGGLTALAAVAVVAGVQWEYPAFVDHHPDVQAASLARAAAGATVTLPINPPGWAVTVVKH